MKNKILALILAMMLVLSMVACGAKAPAEEPAPAPEADAPAADAPAEAPADEDFTIATVVKLTGIAWYDRMEVGIEKFKEDTGIDAFMTGHNTADPAEQVKVIEDLLAQGVDALVVIPNSTEAVESVLAKAREQGVVVIAHEATNIKNADYDLEAFDNAAYGQHFMEILGEMMGGKGQYTTFVGSLTATSHNEWVDASVGVQKAKYPEMELVANKNESSEDSEIAYQKTKELMLAYPEIIGYQGSAMADIPGVARAIQEAGKEDETYVIGTCLVSSAAQYLETGAIDCISFWDPADAGYALNELALKCLRGEEITDGLDLTPAGYQDLHLEGNVFAGKAWIDVTIENMGDYNF